MTMHVAVLLGGVSVEREVSLVSGEACAVALESKGYRVSRIDAARDLPGQLMAARPDRVFNALHGRMGEDGRVQGLLDLMGVPYTHSGVLASALAMDKPMAKLVFTAAGLRCAPGVTTELGALEDGLPLPAPVVVKPAAEGSSVGVTILLEDDPRPLLTRNDIDRSQRVLVERYIPGRELSCGVMGGRPLAVTEIRPKDGFYDYRAKYTEGLAVHDVPADLPPAVYEQVLDASARAYRALGCRGCGRADFRYDPAEGEDGIYILEVNTQPGMAPLSLLPEQAAYCGIAFADLVERLLQEATCDR